RRVLVRRYNYCLIARFQVGWLVCKFVF
ncbi:efflux transporter, RND family, MFP subunit, partial [Vibrio parahaemolyticus EKP-028]